MNDAADNVISAEKRRYDNYPIVTLTGVVSSKASSLCRTSSGEFWTFFARFDAWRIGDGPISTVQLTISREVTIEDGKKLRELITADSVVSVRARISDKDLTKRPKGHLEEFIERNSTDTELHSYLATVTKPIVYQDETLGRFNFERKWRSYAGRCSLGEKSINLTVTSTNTGSIDASCFENARTLCRDLTSWDLRARDFTSQSLLSLKNQTWRSKDESELNPEQFKNKMELISIDIHSGGFTLWYDDGQLFLGHKIQVQGNLAAGIASASF